LECVDSWGFDGSFRLECSRGWFAQFKIKLICGGWCVMLRKRTRVLETVRSKSNKGWVDLCASWKFLYISKILWLGLRSSMCITPNPIYSTLAGLRCDAHSSILELIAWLIIKRYIFYLHL
jgi:hypothetical protein